MRIIKRLKASKPGLEAHYVSSTRPVTGPTSSQAVANLGHWTVRPVNSRSTARIWRFH